MALAAGRSHPNHAQPQLALVRRKESEGETNVIHAQPSLLLLLFFFGLVVPPSVRLRPGRAAVAAAAAAASLHAQREATDDDDDDAIPLSVCMQAAGVGGVGAASNATAAIGAGS